MTLLHINPTVKTALANGEPVVALESTVITHGLPYPQNLETAQNMEAAVRDGGATPATIALLAGQIHIGLSPDQLQALAQKPSHSVRKCSRRDIPLAIANQEDGGTTVAGTMILAHQAGIEVFATGGIGGVHRGHPFDVSADLIELGRTPVTVVSSGCKSILDMPLTYELLETHGVPVIGYQTDYIPAFFSRSSGLTADIRLDTPQQVAATIHARRQLGLASGTLVTVPVPEADALPQAEAEAAISQAITEADSAGIHGGAATPWLLARIVELTNGRSLKANQAFLLNNARVAAQIAAAL
ncbi:MAG TPA: pseudouridine-5'-phosphate glycosidase [Anaerolineae bacterium]|nr:pseudouridine-5'-phosphate glycosidase [Anaerolineae bacterium]